MKIKSDSLLILMIVISGLEIITLGFPPNLTSLASISPSALDILDGLINWRKYRITESLPGITLNGIVILNGLFFGSKSNLFPPKPRGKFL